MTYWLCQPNKLSRITIAVSALLFSLILVTGSYPFWQLNVMLSLVFYLTYTLLKFHAQMPIALIVRNNEWRCLTKTTINSYYLKTGYVLGHIAVIDLVDDSTNKPHRLFLLSWDVNSSSLAQSATWNQLRTTLKYAKGPQRRPFLSQKKPESEQTVVKDLFLKNGL